VHALNVMVDAGGAYLALLDWGDAGWGDPAIELATFAADGLDDLFAGYAEEAPELAGAGFPGRVLWNQIGHALRKAARSSPGRTPELATAHLRGLAAFARAARGPWRAWAPDLS